jgi:hypothetical protein
MEVSSMFRLPCFKLLEIAKRMKILQKVVKEGNRDTSMASSIFEELGVMFENGEIAELLLIKDLFQNQVTS